MFVYLFSLRSRRKKASLLAPRDNRWRIAFCSALKVNFGALRNTLKNGTFNPNLKALPIKINLKNITKNVYIYFYINHIIQSIIIYLIDRQTDRSSFCHTSYHKSHWPYHLFNINSHYFL